MRTEMRLRPFTTAWMALVVRMELPRLQLQLILVDKLEVVSLLVAEESKLSLEDITL